MWRPRSQQQEIVRAQAARPYATGPRARLKITSDHMGDNAEIAWVSHGPDNDTDSFPSFSFQLYVLHTAPTTAADAEFPMSWVHWVEQVGGIADPNVRCHFCVYRNRLDNILQCIAHQRREVAHRNRNGLWPRLISSWTTDHDRGYRGFIIVIDRDTWRTDGLVFVDFDRPPYDREEIYNLTHTLPADEECIAKAYRLRDVTCLGQLLRTYWSNAGHMWTQQDLSNRNRGGFSPALYPAVDPDAHHDAEHNDDDDDDESVAHSSLPSLDTSGEQSAEPVVRAVHQFDSSALWKTPADLPDLRVEVYEDTVGWHITSVWSSRHSQTRPAFSYVMYLATDTPPFSAQALFHCLDWGLLRNSPWTLDVIRVPDIESAYYHYSHETPKRNTCRTQQRRACARSILDRVARPLLPEELLQYIESIIVPPAHPRYSFMLDRPYPGMFLFLDSKSQNTGPTIVYTKAKTGDEVADGGLLGERLTRQYANEFSDELLITKLQHWRLVADELHTVWSMCSPRYDLAVIPELILTLHFPDTCDLDLRFRPALNNMLGMHAVLTNCGTEPITMFPRFAPDFWLEGLDIYDMTEDRMMPRTDCDFSTITYPRWHSWLKEDLASDFASTTSNFHALKTLNPGTGTVFLMEEEASPQRWWMERYQAGIFQNGHEYRVRVRDDLQIPRWTFGYEGNLKGPYNLPPLPVRAKNEAHFRFRTVNAPSWIG